MTAHSQPCEICRYFIAPDDYQPVTHNSPGIGPVCAKFSVHTISADIVLRITAGIAAHPLPDHTRPNSRRSSK